MWISQQSKLGNRQQRHAQVGVVTAQGESVGVYTDGCQCLLPVVAPGGYRWKPKNGQQVLVMKSGADGEAACVVARHDQTDHALNPGEVELYANGCSVKLDETGTVRLNGAVLVNDVPLEALIEAVVQRTLAGQEGT